jgi:hypothetical protein
MDRWRKGAKFWEINSMLAKLIAKFHRLYRIIGKIM